MPDQSERDEPNKSDRAAGPLERGSSGSTADMAVEAPPDLSDRSPDEPYARPAEPIPPDELPDQLAGKKAARGAREAKTDEAIEESFPASDPPSFQPKTT